jgi:hypothetical protein
MLSKKGKRRQSSFHKIMELMHVKKKRLSYTASNYVVRTFSKPLARVHPGFILCLSSKVVISKLTLQILMHAKLHLSFFLCSLHALKIPGKNNV